MWKRLDEKYGKASDVVMFDIKQLKVIKEGDNKRFIELFDTVERGYCDLERLSIQHEIFKSTAVSMIKEKLPGDVRRERSKEVNHADTKADDPSRAKRGRCNPSVSRKYKMTCAES